MAKLSSRSIAAVASCQNVLANAALLILPKLPGSYDISYIEGHRTSAEQEQLFAKGRLQNSQGQWTVVDRNKVVTNADGIVNRSQHQFFPSCALDFIPYPGGYSAEPEMFAYLAGMLQASCSQRLTWGGDWNSNQSTQDHKFIDLPHIQLTGDVVYAEPLDPSVQHFDEVVAYRRSRYGEDWCSRFPSSGRILPKGIGL